MPGPGDRPGAGLDSGVTRPMQGQEWGPLGCNESTGMTGSWPSSAVSGSGQRGGIPVPEGQWLLGPETAPPKTGHQNEALGPAAFSTSASAWAAGEAQRGTSARGGTAHGPGTPCRSPSLTWGSGR